MRLDKLTVLDAVVFVAKRLRGVDRDGELSRDALGELHMKPIAAAIATLGLVACASADAQQTQATSPPPCSSAEYRQMDFWLGTWDAYYAADAAEPGGRNVITRAYDNCVIQEDFDGGPQAQGLIGHSVSTYQAGPRMWRQTWVDNQGGYFALTGGPVGDDFVLSTTRITENAPYQRMLFEDIQPQSFTWRWQSSTDAGATWTDQWVIFYRRAAAQ